LRGAGQGLVAGSDLLLALEHLHGLAPVVMHRDVKPANILVARNLRTLKLTDFGLAKGVPRASGWAVVPASAEHTTCIGTPRYAAPEVFRVHVYHSAYSEKVDVYSAGLVIWYLLTGWVPDHNACKYPLRRPDVESSRRRWEAMSDLLERMWDTDPGWRPTAAECVAAVQGMPAGRLGCLAGGRVDNAATMDGAGCLAGGPGRCLVQ